MKAVILCGGFATRMGDLCAKTPKALTLVLGKPVLTHQIDVLKNEGINDFIFVTGHLHREIESYFGNGSRFGVNISYFYESTPLGTAGALFKLNLTEDFLLCNGDLVFNFNLQAMLDFHRRNKALITLFTHPNAHPYDSTLVKADEHGRVTAMLSPNENREACLNLCNAGILIISPEILKAFNIDGKANFDKDILLPAIKTDKVFSYKSAEYVYDMGTPERLIQVENDLKAHIPAKKYLLNKKKAVFLDRDGTINIHNNFIASPDDMQLIPKAAKAIAELNKLGYLVVVVTNQPVVARGECTLEELFRIHCKMEQLLGLEGAYIDALYFCPHHPDSGFENEIKELKINCNCRKPKPGMLLMAQRELNIDLLNSYIVGDRLTDVQAGINAGCTPVYLTESSNEAHACNLTFKSLYDFSQYLVNKDIG